MEANPALSGAAQALARMAADQRQLEGMVIEDHPVRYTKEGRLVIQDGTGRNGMEVQAPTNIRSRFSPEILNICRIRITGSTGMVTEILANQAVQQIRAAQAASESLAAQLDNYLRNGSILLTLRGSYMNRTGVYKHFADRDQVGEAIQYYLGGKWAGIRHVDPSTFEFTLDIQAPGRNLRMYGEQDIERWTLSGSITNIDPPRVSVEVFHFGPIT